VLDTLRMSISLGTELFICSLFRQHLLAPRRGLQQTCLGGFLCSKDEFIRMGTTPVIGSCERLALRSWNEAAFCAYFA
jgi:hypothetical protein